MRWTPDISTGTLTLAQACAYHDLLIEEIENWISTYEAHGTHGLRITRLQCYYPERLRPGTVPRP
jgi:hypothetical protein